MKKLFLLIFLSALICNLSAAISVENLTCEYQQNPLGIDAVAPKLSWQLHSTAYNQAQTSYQILVATSPELLQQHTGNVWDSGKISSCQSAHISYAGAALQSRQRYYWQVRIWDQNDNPSAWSADAWWEMGLLQPTDWTAAWISAPKVFDWVKLNRTRTNMPATVPPEQDEPAPLLRRDFACKKAITSARIYIAGLGYYELYLNGKKIGDHILDPAFTRYDKRVLYTTYDVSEQLQTGANAIGVMLGNGWYNMPSRGVWGFDMAEWRAEPVVRCQLCITFADGSEQTISSDASWQCHSGPVTFNSIRQGEFYDAQLEQPGWHTANFDASNWLPVHKVRGPEGQLSAQTLPPIKIMQRLQPVSITTINDSVFVVDFGQSMAGFTELTVHGPKNTTIQLIHGEQLYEDGRVDQRGIASLVKSAPFQTDQYTLKGEGTETWHPRFVYHGFRWVEVHGFPGTPSKENFTACVVYTSFEPAGSFASSNPLLNQIQHNTLWSYISNFHGYPTDCPHREKNGWTGDAHLAAETGLYNFNAQSAYIKWMQDIADEQQSSGEIAAIVPTAGWGYYWGNGPAWDNAYILIPWYLYLYNGNLEILATHYENMQQYVDFLSTKADNFIVSWGLGDWAPAKTQAPAEITSTAYYYVDAALLAKIANLLGKDDDAEKFTVLAENIKKAFLQKFYHAKDKNIGDGSQTAMACALYQGLLDDKKAKGVYATLEKSLATCEMNFDCGILGTKYLFNVLAEMGDADLAYARINTNKFPGWGYWIEQGATTLWENWNGEASRLHVMYGDVSAWFYKYLAGIQPDETQPGFKHFFIQPYFPADLEWVKASHDCMFGSIASSWQQQNQHVEMQVKIPVNTSATIILPQASTRYKILDASDELVNCKWHANQTDLGSGDYKIAFDL